MTRYLEMLRPLCFPFFLYRYEFVLLDFERTNYVTFPVFLISACWNFRTFVEMLPLKQTGKLFLQGEHLRPWFCWIAGSCGSWQHSKIGKAATDALRYTIAIKLEGDVSMEYDAIVQSILDLIDQRITEDIRVDELARAANYSTSHFSRVFMAVTGTPVMNYVIRRKLAYAQYDLAMGRRIIDVAMEYGFETHAGFTKAFKRFFGYPPLLHRLHISASPPERATVYCEKLKQGGINMQVQIKKIESFTIVGYTSRHRMPGVSNISDIPGFWEKTNMEYEAALSTLHHTYSKSHHCEVAVCFDIDEKEDCFTYMLGVGADEADAEIAQRPGTYRYEIQSGLYAVFTTPKVHEEQYVQSIHDAWKQILNCWLPESAYEYDGMRAAFEYYDERDHGTMAQMDIYIPVQQCEANK